MHNSLKIIILLACAVLMAGCGITQPAQTGGFVPVVGSDAVYVSDATAGTVVELTANLLQNGQLAPAQSLSGLSGVTQVTPATDNNALYACTPGAITVLAIDHNGATGNLSVQQTFSTVGVIDTPIVAIADAGGFLLVAGTQAGAATVVAFPLNADDSLGNAAPSVLPLGGNGAPNGITDLGNGAVAVTVLANSGNLIGVGFNNGVLTPGNSQTIGNAFPGGVANNGTFVYAAGDTVLSAFTEDATGTLAETSSVSTGGPNTSVVVGPTAVFVGTSNASRGVVAVALNADGTLGAAASLGVVNAIGTPVGVTAITLDSSNFLYPALAGGGAASLAFPSLTSPVETPPVSSGGTNPSSIATVPI